MPELRELDLQCSNLSGVDLSGLSCSSSSLERLDLTATRLEQKQLVCLANLHSLTFLALSSNFFGDAGLSSLRSLTNLTTLHLAHLYRVTDSGVTQLAVLPRLSELDLCGTGVLGATLSGLSALKTLNLSHTRVNDELCLPNVENLSLANCVYFESFEALVPSLTGLDARNLQDVPFALLAARVPGLRRIVFSDELDARLARRFWPRSSIKIYA
jgi:uncharacterized protein YjbI with pentapeptide repeats